MDIRIIYDYNLSKNINQYNNIIKLMPKHELFVYNGIEPNIDKTSIKKIKYNIYFDIISVNFFLNYPSEYTILIVNDEYVNKNKYLREEYYIDRPLIKIKKVVHYYFCLTEFSYNYLHNIKKIKKKKLLLLNGFYNKINNMKMLTNKTKYIYYEIDTYSGEKNILILKTWLKYFINRPEILLVKYLYRKENINIEFGKLLHAYNEKKMFNDDIIYSFKNIIFFKNDKFLKNYEQNISVSILNFSYFNLINKIYDNILKNRIIITLENDISKEYLFNNNLFYSKFNENNLYTVLSFYFNLNINNIQTILSINRKNLITKINKTQKKLNKFFISNI